MSSTHYMDMVGEIFQILGSLYFRPTHIRWFFWTVLFRPFIKMQSVANPRLGGMKDEVSIMSLGAISVVTKLIRSRSITIELNKSAQFVFFVK